MKATVLLKDRFHRKKFRWVTHSVEITEFYCHSFFANFPSNQHFTKELYSKLIWRKKFAWRQWLSRFSTLQGRPVKSTRRRLVLKKLQKVSPNQLIYYKSAMYIIFTKYFSCEIKFPDYCWYGNYLLYYFLFWQKFRSFSTKQLIWRNIFDESKFSIFPYCAVSTQCGKMKHLVSLKNFSSN